MWHYKHADFVTGSKMKIRGEGRSHSTDKWRSMVILHNTVEGRCKKTCFCQFFKQVLYLKVGREGNIAGEGGVIQKTKGKLCIFQHS